MAYNTRIRFLIHGDGDERKGAGSWFHQNERTDRVYPQLPPGMDPYLSLRELVQWFFERFLFIQNF